MIWCTVCIQAGAQFVDRFDDQQLDSDPAWQGETSRFVVTDNRLRLQAPAQAGSASIHTASTAALSVSWDFYFQLDFNPSSANFLKVYLVADNENLIGPVHGYFLKAGENDDISLFRQNGTEEIKIVDGRDGILNLSAVRARVRVVRDFSGEFQLLTDVGLSGSWTLEGISMDRTFVNSTCFGLVCTYTATRSDKFWFDDFEAVNIPVVDIFPPVLINAWAFSENEIDLLFSETLQPDSATLLKHFTMTNMGHPGEIHLKSDNTLALILLQPMVSGHRYQLSVSGIVDSAGNVMADSTLEIRYYQDVKSVFKDIIFTEVMVDPNPQVGLPDAEFIEIYNRSIHALNLVGWVLTDGTSSAIFPDYILRAGEYCLVTASSAVPLFQDASQKIGLNNFPTLNNSGDMLLLKNQHGITMDSIRYNLTWYRDVDKSEGGWTLELIDPDNPCADHDNWTASESLSGGSPGRQNSTYASKPDLTGPFLEEVAAESSRIIVCQFNERLDGGLLVSNFAILPSRQIFGCAFIDASKRIVKLELVEPLQSGVTYQLLISKILDCNQNMITPVQISFGLPESPEPGDLLINEILFNPKSGGSDFIEFFNVSKKYISTSELKLANADNDTPVNIKSISTHRLVPPGAYVVFTDDPETVMMQYPSGEKRNIHQSDLPGLPDDDGSLMLLNGEGQVIDALSYSRQWHSPFIQDESGVSLERLSWTAPTQSRDNWNSSGSSSGFGTPGYANTQHRENNFIATEEVNIEPELFSPGVNQDGFVQIRYQFSQPGMMVNVTVIDPQGHHLKTIAESEWVGAEGFFRWDGEGDHGQIVRRGYYLVLFEAFGAAGGVRIFRKRVIVTSR